MKQIRLEGDKLILGKKAQTKILVAVMLGLLLLGVFVVASSITQVQPSPANQNTSNDSVVIEFNSTCEDCNPDAFKFHWSGTNYSLWEGLVFMSNLDNRSELGENDTFVLDLSGTSNGTVFGGATFNSTGGKYNGAYLFGSGDYIEPAIRPEMNLNGTVCEWLSINDTVGNAKVIFNYGSTGYTNAVWFRVDDGGVVKVTYYDNDTTGELGTSTGSNVLVANAYSHVCATYGINEPDGIIKTYFNGNLINTDTENTLAFNFTDLENENMGIGKSALGNQYYGYIDEPLVWNRTLTDDEINQVYQISLTKYNNTNWNFYTNRSNPSDFNYSSLILNASNPTKDFNYYLCTNNGTEICSTLSTITQTLKNLTSIVNFSQSRGVLRSDFYGFNTHMNFLNIGRSNGGQIDSNLDNTTSNDIFPNSTWHREKYLDVGGVNQRGDMYLARFYTYLQDMDFERWWNESYGNYTSSGVDIGLFGWRSSAQSAGVVGNASSSTDSYSGNKSLNLSNVGTGGNVFLFQSISQDYLPDGLYNFSVWAKTNNSGMTVVIYNMSGAGSVENVL